MAAVGGGGVGVEESEGGVLAGSLNREGERRRRRRRRRGGGGGRVERGAAERLVELGDDFGERHAGSPDAGREDGVLEGAAGRGHEGMEQLAELDAIAEEELQVGALGERRRGRLWREQHQLRRDGAPRKVE